MGTSLPGLAVEAATLGDVLRLRAASQPDRLGVEYCPDRSGPTVRLTYAELDARARAAAELVRESAAPGARVVLIYPPGVEFLVGFFGSTYAGTVPVPAPPPELTESDTVTRLEAIVDNARPALGLTTSALRLRLEDVAARRGSPINLRLLATDVSSLHGPRTSRAALVSPLAMLQYSSGSTRTPRGVMLGHDNVLHNLAFIHPLMDCGAATRVVSWLPFFHDLGLIGPGLASIFSGWPLTLLSPTSFLQRPLSWLEAIARGGVVVSGGPNFAYDLCVRRTTEEQRARLDLRNWQVAFNAAEPIRYATLERFTSAFAPAGFRARAFFPAYGLAEATLLATGGDRAEAPRVRNVLEARLQDGVAVPPDREGEGVLLVSSGAVSPATRVAIVAPDTRLIREPGQVGEIWLAGPSIAHGYWQRPEETNVVFQAYEASSGEGPFLRTGDLGFVQDGHLFVTGRITDLIVIRGKNHYPHDIELTVEESHSAVRRAHCAAFSIDENGAERLVVAAEVDHQYARKAPVADVGAQSGPAASGEITRRIRQAVLHRHGLQAHHVVLLRPGTIPKTSSGKIQRQACRSAFLKRTLYVLGESDPGES